MNKSLQYTNAYTVESLNYNVDKHTLNNTNAATLN